MLFGFDRFGADHREPTCWPVDAVAPLEGVRCGGGGGLNELPHGVFAGRGESGVVHQGVCCLPGCFAEFGIVLPGAGVGLQLKRAQFVFSGQRYILNLRLGGRHPQHREAEQKSQEAQGEVKEENVILPLMVDDRILRRLPDKLPSQRLEVRGCGF